MLNRYYGQPRWTASRPLMDVLVETILSQNTSDSNSHRAFLALKKKYPRWETLAGAEAGSIALTIRAGGLANIKSRRIKELISFIVGKQGRAGLEFLKKLPRGEAYQYLLAIKGVGPKTAACTLLFGAGIPVYPVDTHIYRVSNRLGWVRKKEDREKFQDRFRKLVPDEMVYPLHLNIIEHGRKICHPRKPECPGCRLIKLCNWKEKTHEAVY
ncbi:MAG: endonuclease III [Candidatus Edwardsbacteria bacterium]|nr:endonuclease III [Candidatus Edwardsbacteria bacterium]MBU1576862.1 endonuclease III [Candidatus Edwardsbacteria bacterium]MBU2464399.1 endonuclease III [Candidatus Edwardsbacteria bacterium]MBU2593474.1 endonuclease III [Candidatus Edwardsbacteria bacterium]